MMAEGQENLDSSGFSKVDKVLFIFLFCKLLKLCLGVEHGIMKHGEHVSLSEISLVCTSSDDMAS